MTISEFLAQPTPRPETWATGFPSLDAVAGGFRREQLWVITGAPGTGKSLLLTQLVYALAVDHAFKVEYHCARIDDPALTRSRLVSLAVRRAPELPDLEVPLDDLPRRSQQALESLKSSRLDVCLGGGFAIPDWRDGDVSKRCLSVDDPEGKRSPVLDQAGRDELRQVADSGAVVLVTVPLSHCIDLRRNGESLREEWSAVADLIIEVVADNVGSSILRLQQNRRGPLRDIPVLGQTHWARFIEPMAL